MGVTAAVHVVGDGVDDERHFALLNLGAVGLERRRLFNAAVEPAALRKVVGRRSRRGHVSLVAVACDIHVFRTIGAGAVHQRRRGLRLALVKGAFGRDLRSCVLVPLLQSPKQAVVGTTRIDEFPLQLGNLRLQCAAHIFGLTAEREHFVTIGLGLIALSR